MDGGDGGHSAPAALSSLLHFLTFGSDTSLVIYDFADTAVFADFAGFPAQQWSDSSEAVRVGRKPQPALTRQAGTAIIVAVLDEPYLTP